MDKLRIASVIFAGIVLLSYRYTGMEDTEMVPVKGGNLATVDPVTKKNIEVKN